LTRKPTYEELEHKIKELEKETLTGRQTEEAVWQSEERYRTIFESTGTATITSHEDMTILMANSEFENLSGYSKTEIEGKKKWTEFVVEGDLERLKGYHRLRRIDPGAAPRNHEFRFVDRDGNVRHIFATVAMIPGTKMGVSSFMDITDLKQAAEERLIRKKLEGVLEMAGAVCHEMNQPMQVILGNCELLMLEIDGNNPYYDRINIIKNQIEAMGNLTGKLMNIKGYKTIKYFNGRIIDIHRASE